MTTAIRGGKRTVLVQAWFSPEEHEKLRGLAESRGTSMSAVIRWIVRETWIRDHAMSPTKMAARRLQVRDWERIVREDEDEAPRST